MDENFFGKYLQGIKKVCNFALANERERCEAETGRMQGEVAEWSIAAVLKTVEGHTSGGSNPSLSAKG